MCPSADGRLGIGPSPIGRRGICPSAEGRRGIGASGRRPMVSDEGRRGIESVDDMLELRRGMAEFMEGGGGPPEGR